MKTFNAVKTACWNVVKGTWLHCFMAVCLVATMAPGIAPSVALAKAQATPQQNIELACAGFEQYGRVYFGNYEGEPIVWNLLPHPHEYTYSDKSVDPKGDAALLMSEYVLAEKPYNEGGKAVYWKNSSLRSWLNGEFLGDAFTPEEQTYLLKTSNEGYQFRRLDGDQVFLPDALEVSSYVYGWSQDSIGVYRYAHEPQPAYDRAGNAHAWWTRQINGQESHATAAYVVTGTDASSDTGSHSWIMDEQEPEASAGVRPFVSLDMRQVLFTAPADRAAGELGLKANAARTTNELKLTMCDASRTGFAVTQASATGAPGQVVSLSYSGAKTGAHEYISAMITDPANPDEVLYYGQVKQLASPSDASGTVEFALPEGLSAGSTYTVKLFNEQVNGAKQTNFSSEFESVNLEVKRAVVASDFNFEPPTDATYDGTAKTATVSVRPGVAGMGEPTLHYYQGAFEVANPTNAGTYTVKIDVSEGDTYAAATGVSDPSWTFTIAKAASHIEIPAEGTVVTYGDDVTLTAEVDGALPAAEEGEPEAAEDDYVEFYAGEGANAALLGRAPVTYDDPASAHGHAELSLSTAGKTLQPGANTVVARYSGNVNLCDSGSSAATVMLLPKTVGLSWTGAFERSYDATASNVSAAATGVVAGDEVSVAVNGGAQVNAGTYTARAIGLAGAQADYYQLPEEATCSYSIAPQVVTARVAPIAAQTYTGSEIRPAIVAFDGEREIPVSEYRVVYSGNTQVGRASVTLEDVPGGNYVVSGTASFEIVAASHGSDPVVPSNDDHGAHGTATSADASNGAAAGAATATDAVSAAGEVEAREAADAAPGAQQLVGVTTAATPRAQAPRSSYDAGVHVDRAGGVDSVTGIRNALVKISAHSPLLLGALVLAMPSTRPGVSALYARARRLFVGKKRNAHKE